MSSCDFTAEEKAELLDCPFCGDKPVLYYEMHDLDDWVVQCSNCGSSSCPEGIRYVRGLAISDWNTRKTNKKENNMENLEINIGYGAALRHKETGAVSYFTYDNGKCWWSHNPKEAASFDNKTILLSLLKNWKDRSAIGDFFVFKTTLKHDDSVPVVDFDQAILDSKIESCRVSYSQNR